MENMEELKVWTIDEAFNKWLGEERIVEVTSETYQSFFNYCKRSGQVMTCMVEVSKNYSRVDELLQMVLDLREGVDDVIFKLTDDCSINKLSKRDGDEAIISAVLGGSTMSLLFNNKRVQVDARGKRSLSVDRELTLLDGKKCGREPNFNFKPQPILDVVEFKTCENLCTRQLEHKFNIESLKSRVNTDCTVYTSLQFNEDLSKSTSDLIKEDIEKLVWFGDKDKGDLIDGFLKQIRLSGDVVFLNTYKQGSNILEKLKFGYQKMNVNETNKEDFRILLGQNTYNKIYTYMVDNGLIKDGDEMNTLHSTTAKIEVIQGLNNSAVTLLTRIQNLIAGTNLDEAEMTNYYSNETQQLYIDSRFSLGVGVKNVNKIGVINL